MRRRRRFSTLNRLQKAAGKNVNALQQSGARFDFSPKKILSIIADTASRDPPDATSDIFHFHHVDNQLKQINSITK